ncbi:enoyl-CoA hydratase/isomerase family protein [Arthrobacter sp. JSM 101049]|uniref:enoyl-CoA hydratase/isomerase family protein n=1 Tax=Arthrobacter sp. JSM 101049 TaxID=929097 RepID=UPI00356AADED
MHAQEIVREDMHDDGILTWTLDAPGTAVNLLDAAFIAALAGRLDAAEARLAEDQAAIAGIILTSAKESFCASADLDAMAAATPTDAQAVYDLALGMASAFRRLETLGVPVVAAVNGSALGGGLGLALATNHRIALDEPGIRFGLPEVGFGLCPGAGGVLRTVRLLGVERSLDELLLGGSSFGTQDAIQRGIVDEAVDDEEELIPAARQWLRENPHAVQPWDADGYRIPGGIPGLPAATGTDAVAAVLQFLPARLRSRRDALHNPAPRAILAAAVEGAQVDVNTAAVIEARYHTQTVVDPVSTAMIGLRHADRKAAGQQSVDATTGAVPDSVTAAAGESVPGVHTDHQGNPDADADEALDPARRAGPDAARRMVVDLNDAARVAAGDLVAEGMAGISVVRAAGQAGLSSPLYQSIEEAVGQTAGAHVPATGGTGAQQPGLDTAAAQRRLLSAIAEAGRRHLADRDAAAVAALNIASVDGAGFPAWTGGIARWRDA